MRILTLAVCFLAAASWEVAKTSNFLSRGTAENSSSNLEYWIGFHDEVAFLACANHGESLEHPVVRTLPKAWTVWSRPGKRFYGLARRNLFKGIRMVVFLLSGVGEEGLCARLPGKATLGTNLADWVLLRVGDSVRQAGNTTASNASSLSCRSLGAPSPKRDVCVSFEGATALHRKRGFPEGDEKKRLSAALAGQQIVIACMPTRFANSRGSLSCYTPFARGILRALRSYNATLILKRCKDLNEAGSAVGHGDADILMAFTKQDEQIMEVFNLPRPHDYAYETFYSMRKLGGAEVSFFAVLLGSKEGFCSLLAVLLLVWLATGVRDYCHAGAVRLDAVLDSGMFLIASFLANSAPLPQQGAGNRRNSLSRAITLTAWMLAILPLSVYFRGELTSRLTVTVPLDQMDTLEKLEHALDRGDVQPCILRDGCMSTTIEGTIPHRNQTLLAKLQKAFQRRKTANVFDSTKGCLECASRPGFACFSCNLQGCIAHAVRRRLVESREPFNLAFATMPTTKGYRLARAYDQLLQRLFETALRPFNDKEEHCDPRDDPSWHAGGDPPGARITQVFELSAFFATFACLMCVSLVVLCVELAFGRHRMTHGSSL